MNADNTDLRSYNTGSRALHEDAGPHNQMVTAERQPQ
jgi:hypothetical protein